MSKSKANKIIEDVKDFLKKDLTVQRLFAEHGVILDWIDYIPIKFDVLNVSAKTDHGIIIINTNLLLKTPKEISSYVVHETVHYLQQCFGEKGTKSSDDGNYLDNPYEQEAFKAQIKFIADNESENKAEEYVENLLDHHNVEKDERKEKEDILLSEV